jgi:hypothetical protein
MYATNHVADDDGDDDVKAWAVAQHFFFIYIVPLNCIYERIISNLVFASLPKAMFGKPM